MAYAEKRGRYWRGRYKGPSGHTPAWPTISVDDRGLPFESKQAALDAANNKEAEVRKAGAKWRDPTAGDIKLDEWLESRWWPAQDLEDRTEDQYRYRIKHMISPAFGGRPVNSLTDPEEIATWALGLVPRYAKSTASDSRSLLATILGDAKDAGLVEVNAAVRRRGRGRKKTRQKGRRRRVNKAWATPIEALLTAERSALLTGQDDDFVMWVTGAWTATRWGELIGLEQGSFRLSAVHIDWQLSELNGKFTRCDPKDESFRNGDPDYFGPVDLPPFLSDLLSRFLQSRPPRLCRCRGRSCGAGRMLFLGPKGGHYSRSDYNRRFWHPAVDGIYPEQGGKDPRPARPVLVDMAAGWPGVPLKPAWPYAVGDGWEPPRGQGWTRFDQTVDARRVACESCGAGPGSACTSRAGRDTTDHRPRLEAAAAAGGCERALASWLPVKPGLTPHGLRHAHKTWMIEDGIPEVLQHDRLGHVMGGIGATYSHVSAGMRDQVKKALQERWESALDERLRLCQTSPVPLLNELLVSRRERQPKIISQLAPRKGKTPSPLPGNRACDLWWR